jgi:flagellar hook-associated protein FlgK
MLQEMQDLANQINNFYTSFEEIQNDIIQLKEEYDLLKQ